MGQGRLMSDGPDPGLAERLLVEVRERLHALDDVLRGKDGKNGLVAKVNALWAAHHEAQEARRHEIVPKDRGSVLTDPKVWAIWGGVAAGFLSLAADVLRYLMGGN